MEKGFGGPVWHASVCLKGNQASEVSHRVALRALQGVGDESLGQWIEQGRKAYHIRRRLSLAEQIEAGLTMQDVRGTAEGIRRAREAVSIVPQVYALAREELRDYP